MKCPYLGIGIALVALSTLGCVRSLEPVGEEFVREPGVVGTWLDEEGDSVFDVVHDERTRYLVRLRNSECEEQIYVMSVGRLGEARFLNLTHRLPEDEDLEMVLLTHYVFRADIEPSRLILTTLDEDWLRERIGVDAPFARDEGAGHGDVVLLDSAERVNAFVAAQLDNPEAWEDSGSVVRADPSTVEEMVRSWSCWAADPS